eukprot:CAMPEP_0178947958 /NCGR_PEP_ID=MMETSP0789-20121207/5198_1 /TAXON_ID=3005 /ORGANISM="Rhizosolenia setigera, Strain CCMP 1694" /LENGTH=67 /DNA_ID=CAMNT_0020628255 /DNA_START=49 /DNA_END=252 /DNA_ORIENTATION=-
MAGEVPTTSWRQLSGMKLFFHECKHVGNRPFAIGFGVMTGVALYAQMKFTDEMKAGSEYYQEFHAKK